eukprot:6187346-Prymnesium_polylepis.1
MLDLDRSLGRLVLLCVLEVLLARDALLLALELRLGRERNARARDSPPPPGRALKAWLDAPTDVDVVGDDGRVGLGHVANVARLTAADADGLKVAAAPAGVPDEDGAARLCRGFVDQGAAR